MNAVQILEDAEQIFPAVYRMIATAEKRIFLEMYLLEGEIGLRIIRQLREKAAQGVDVRLLYQPPVTNCAATFYNEPAGALQAAAGRESMQSELSGAGAGRCK